ncbi:hypothetical protein [Lentzea sp. E54]|uniref:hypothetical protein n=1 Tax=Lentzea xerophila TaxID=3435883 RepID=UPI003DA64C60
MSAKISVEAARELRARIWFGLPLIAAGAFLVGDAAQRLVSAWNFVGRYWPWLLLGLACLNLIRSLFRVESLLAPGLVAVVALTALALRSEVASSMILDWVLPVLIIVVGTTLLWSVGARVRRSWTRVLSTGRVAAPEELPKRLRPRAIVGEIEVDFRAARSGEMDVDLEVTAVFGWVRIVVPRAWQVELGHQGVLLSKIVDRAAGEQGDPRERKLLLHVMGFCGIVSVSRR